MVSMGNGLVDSSKPLTLVKHLLDLGQPFSARKSAFNFLQELARILRARNERTNGATPPNVNLMQELAGTIARNNILETEGNETTRNAIDSLITLDLSSFTPTPKGPTMTYAQRTAAPSQRQRLYSYGMTLRADGIDPYWLPSGADDPCAIDDLSIDPFDLCDLDGFPLDAGDLDPDDDLWAAEPDFLAHLLEPAQNDDDDLWEPTTLLYAQLAADNDEGDDDDV